MSDTSENSGKILGGARPKTMSLKRTVGAGHVKQNFSHGRSKNVVVEKKKKRLITPPGMARPAARIKTESAEPKNMAPAQAPAAATEKPAESKDAGNILSNTEMDARALALSNARERDAVETVERAEQTVARRARDAAEAELLAGQAQDEAARNAGTGTASEVAAPAQEKETARKSKPQKIEKTATAPARPPAARKPDDRKDAPGKNKRPSSPARRGGERRIKGKLTIQNAFNEDRRQRSMAALRRKRQRQKRQLEGTPLQKGKIAREVVVPEIITVQELANRMSERAVDVIKFLMKEGEMYKMNDVIDADTAELIVEEFGHTMRRVSEADVEEGFIGEEDSEEDMLPRAPVVTIMGHVDHGKTSLLDAIRQTSVVTGEAGGITQHIGAYQVDTGDGHRITFIDTPGHAAFTQMRARGAKVTDIVILVVAANDGVMPQTVEAINHAREAGVPIIVAINKIDLPEADPTRVRTELLQHEIVVESMGGDVLEVEVSATQKTNLDKVLEAILLQAEVLELKANPDRSAEGFVIEAQLERGRGPVATLLVHRGTLTVGQIVVAGSAWGRARALIDDHGDHVKDAGPARPVEVLGLNSSPDAGDQFAVVPSEARAREITEYRERQRRKLLSGGTGRASLEQMMSQLGKDGKKEFNLLIKGDVQGSIEAIAGALDQLGNEEVSARILHSGVGGINESDVTLANASGAAIFGFNVRANVQARDAAVRDHVEIRYYSVIYDLVDDIKAAMSGMLSPELREEFLGNAEILELFNVSKVGKVAGCRVTEGKVERGANVRLIRDNVVVHEGKLSTLKRFKDEASEVVSGQECGMAFEKYQDMRPGDVIECFRVEVIERTL